MKRGVATVVTKDRQLWQKYAESYQLLYQLWPVRNMLQQVIAAGSLRTGRLVLDGGSGPGLLLRALQDGPGPYPTVVAVDSSPEMLAQASLQFYAGIVKVRQANLDEPHELWELPESSFDRIVLNNSLYAAKNPAGTLRELAAVAADEAVLVVSTPRPNPDLTAIEADHLAAVLAAGGDPATEQARLRQDLAPIYEITPQVTSMARCPDEPELRDWFDKGGWVIRSLTTMYANQNWLVVAERGYPHVRGAARGVAGPLPA